MGESLAIAIVLFLVAAVAVIFFGFRLAKYGDALAGLTGWGGLFVGSILVAGATSLPELFTNISAVQQILPVLDKPNPQLALGNILGANLVNMFTMAWVGLVFGGSHFLQRISPQQKNLALVAIAMTGLALVFAALRVEISVWSVGLSSLIILAAYVAGMRWVYVTRPRVPVPAEDDVPSTMTMRQAVIGFSVACGGVIIASPLLAYSVDQIAQLTGIASGALGILAVSLVTTMPEASATVGAMRLGSPDMALSNLYGSNAFNVMILAVADPFYREGVVVNNAQAEHFVAGGIAIGLMFIGLLLILGRSSVRRAVALASLSLMIALYLVGAVMVANLGAPRNQQRAGGPRPAHRLVEPPSLLALAAPRSWS